MIGSQNYPAPLSVFYPLQGNFIGFIGNIASGGLVTQVIASFRRHTQFPCEGAALPGFVTGVGWSEQWSFWEQGYPGLMITDTAPFRYPYQQNDLVIFGGKVYRVRGMQNLGARVALYADKNLTSDVRKVQPYLWRKGVCEQLTF